MTGNPSKPKPEDPNGGQNKKGHLSRDTLPSQWPLGAPPNTAVKSKVADILKPSDKRPSSSWR